VPVPHQCGRNKAQKIEIITVRLRGHGTMQKGLELAEAVLLL
jgi:hypothetical protein